MRQLSRTSPLRAQLPHRFFTSTINIRPGLIAKEAACLRTKALARKAVCLEYRLRIALAATVFNSFPVWPSRNSLSRPSVTSHRVSFRPAARNNLSLRFLPRNSNDSPFLNSLGGYTCESRSKYFCFSTIQHARLETNSATSSSDICLGARTVTEPSRFMRKEMVLLPADWNNENAIFSATAVGILALNPLLGQFH